MSYLKLNKTKIKYNNQVNSPGIILSEVINSDCSYIYPKVITSSNELDIYFGRSFTQREYYNELLSSGASFLLYRPIKEDTHKERAIDVEDYIPYKIVDSNTGELIEKDFLWYDNLPKNGIPEGEKEQGKWLFKIQGGPNAIPKYYLWYEGEYITPDEIPYEEEFSSWTNRDTLRLLRKDWGKPGNIIVGVDEEGESVSVPSLGFEYCHPKYSSGFYTPDYPENLTQEEKDEKGSLFCSVLNHGIHDDAFTIGFTLDFSNVTKFKESDYIVLPLAGYAEYPEVQVCFGNQQSLGPDVIAGAISFNITGNTFEKKLEKFINLLEKPIVIDGTNKTLDKTSGFGYKVLKIKDKVYKIFSSTMLPDKYFYNIKGLVFEKDFETTQNILSILSEDKKRIEFFSKTIGPNDEDIKITIEKLEGNFEEHYRITISRFDYQEIYEGSLFVEEDPETGIRLSIGQLINRYSKLVEVKVYNEYFLKHSNPKDKTSPLYREIEDPGLFEGEFWLKRAVSEKEYTPEDYWRSLELIEETEISEDFLLIPEIENYTIIGASSNYNWIKEYEDLKGYAERKNCQVLVSNHPYKFGCSKLIETEEEPINPRLGIMYGVGRDKDTIIYKTLMENGEWKIFNPHPNYGYRVHEILEAFGEDYKSNHIFNYTKDPWNRLVYFYLDMSYHRYPRPAYYVFLKGIISGKYSEEIDYILYDSPAEYYTEDKLKDLKEKKSNFLSCNGHIFYYREFLNHPGDWKYETTILTRFCMDKVSNTVSRDLPFYLGVETSGEVLSGLDRILNDLKRQYPIIHSLELDHIEEDIVGQTLKVYLDLGVKELLERDIKLSVTLNFNNN